MRLSLAGLLALAILLGLRVEAPLEGGGLIALAFADDDDGGDDGDDGDRDDDGDDRDDDGDDRGRFGDDDDDDDDDDREGRRSRRSGDGDGLLDALRDLFVDDDAFEPNEIVALAGPGLGPEERASLAAAGFSVISETPLAALDAAILRLAAPRGLDAEEALALGRATAPAAILDFNHVYRLNASGCDGPVCWGARAIRLASLAGGACRRGAPMAMIDTAVQTGHPVLEGADIEARSFLDGTAVAAPADHGTAIAALLVGRGAPDAAPLAPGASLLAAEAFRILDDEPGADVVAVMGALDWAVARRARVIAMSFEGSANVALAYGIRRAARRANLVASAGNGGPNGDPAFPAAYPEVIAAAAVDERLRPYRRGTRGAYVELAAPGVDVLSAGSESALASWSGSSFAVPFVAASLLRARAATDGDPRAARALLGRMAKDLGAPGRDAVYGHGLVQAPGDRCW